MNRLRSLCLLCVAVVPLSANTIDYRFVSGVDVQTASFDSAGVTVTGGPGLVFVNVSNGLSVIGGNNSSVNPGEFLDFSFDAGLATAISFHVNSILVTGANLQAFGPGGSLGTQAISVATGIGGGTTNVSSLFGNQLIKHFTLTATSGTDGYRLDTLTFTSVPEPSGFILLISGFAAIAALRIRRSSQFK
jgi:hypothetical protein